MKHLIFKWNSAKDHCVITNKNGLGLGTIEYYFGWKQFIFTSLDDNTIWSAGCLTEVITEINRITAKMKDGENCKYNSSWNERYCGTCKDLHPCTGKLILKNWRKKERK